MIFWFALLAFLTLLYNKLMKKRETWKGSGAEPHRELFSSIWLNICGFPHNWGDIALHVALHPISGAPEALLRSETKRNWSKFPFLLWVRAKKVDAKQSKTKQNKAKQGKTNNLQSETKIKTKWFISQWIESKHSMQKKRNIATGKNYDVKPSEITACFILLRKKCKAKNLSKTKRNKRNKKIRSKTEQKSGMFYFTANQS